MAGLIIDVLLRAQRSRRLVALQGNYTDGKGYALGYVLSLNPELVVLRTINRDGMAAGIKSYQLSDVSQVHFDDRYIRNVEFKENNLDKVYGAVSAPAFLETEYVTVPLLLQRALEMRQLVHLPTYAGADLYGFVQRLTDDELLLEVFTEYGEPDGLTVLKVEDVKSVVWSNEDTRTIELHLRRSKD